VEANKNQVSQNTLNLEKDRYQINKLICVNSMKNICYIELDVTHNTVLYGENNLGKTSILSTLKLHLLPEINFRDSKNKYAFFGASGKAYNNQESRDFYFPSQNSFLILEGQNPFGPYVYILFRASEEQFGYSRIVLPVSYAQIEHEFWDKQSPKNQQLGTINPQLSLKQIKSLVKQHNGKFLRSSQEIRETIYSFNQLNEEKGRFCIIPMKEGGIGREVEAFRRLLQFTFEINQASPASLTSALATIIEGQKKSKKDELEQNLHAIIAEYNDLNLEQEKITQLKNTQDYYQRIKNYFSNSQQGIQQAGELYWQLKGSLADTQEQLLEEQQKIVPEYELLTSDTLPEQESKFKEISRNHQTVHDQQQQITGLLKHEEKKVKRIQFLLEDEFSMVEHSEIEELLQDTINELNRKINSLSDTTSFAAELQNKFTRKNTIKKRIGTLESLMDNAEHSLLYQVSSHSATSLKTIYAGFAQLNLQHSDDVSSTEIQMINDFCQLFSTADNALLFKNLDFIQPLCEFDPKLQHDEWLKEQQNLQDELHKISQQIEHDSRQLKTLTPELLEQQKNHAEKELTQAKNDLSLIIDRDKIEQDFKGHSLASQELTDQLTDLYNQMHTIKEHLDSLKGQKQQLKNRIKDFEQQKNALSGLSKQLNRYTHYEKQFAAQTEDLDPIDVNNETMAKLITQIDTFQFSLEQTEKEIHSLIYKEKLTLLDTDMVYQQGKSLAEITPLVEQLSAEYDNINAYENHLKVLVSKHNKIVGTKVSELEQNNQLINDFRRKLDNAFSGISISDLQEIYIKLKLDPRFEELLADIQSQSVDFYNDTLISADFYDKLNTFCQQFFVAKNGKSETLTLEGLIKEVLYEYRIKGQEKRTTSSQSNGTNAIINSTFLTILLNELIQPNIILALPVVFDEIANLDQQNMLSVVNVVKNNHFSLFSATPTENLQLNNALGHFIDLDLFKAVDESYDEHRDIIYYGGAESIEWLDNTSPEKIDSIG